MYSIVLAIDAYMEVACMNCCLCSQAVSGLHGRKVSVGTGSSVVFGIY